MKGNSLWFPTPACELTSQYQRKCQRSDKPAPECLDWRESVETLEEAPETLELWEWWKHMYQTGRISLGVSVSSQVTRVKRRHFITQNRSRGLEDTYHEEMVEVHLYPIDTSFQTSHCASHNIQILCFNKKFNYYTINKTRYIMTLFCDFFWSVDYSVKTKQSKTKIKNKALFSFSHFVFFFKDCHI